MSNLDLLGGKEWKPLEHLGYVHSFFSVEAETVINTLLIMIVLCALTLATRFVLHKKNNLFRFVIVSFVRWFMDFCKQTLGYHSFHHFSFVISLFIFILLCNIFSIIPWCEEPTRDVNTTLALSTIVFLYIQVYTIKTHGIIAYIKDFLSPFFIMLPLNIIGKLASIISMAFRLFGNIFAGSIIAKIWLGFIQGSLFWELFGIASGFSFMLIGFGLFEGVLQAFVFASLTVTYLGLAVQNEETT